LILVACSLAVRPLWVGAHLIFLIRRTAMYSRSDC